MKNLVARMMCAIIAAHILFGYILGYSFLPYDMSVIFLCIIFPVVILLAIAFARLEKACKKYDTHVLEENITATIKSVWFWILMVFSTLLVIGIIYYAGQMLVPQQEISRRITWDGDAYYGVMFCCGFCSILYLVSLVWIKKTLRLYWK